MSIKLTSTAFAQGSEIPSRYTCDGENVSPPLAWTGVALRAKSLVLIIDDPDAPDPMAPKMTWVHWVVYNIPTSVNAFPEGLKQLPEGALSGLNDWNRTGYGGPCPPIGQHRYFHKLYALDGMLPDLGSPTKDVIEAQMEGHIIAKTELIGTYRKRK